MYACICAAVTDAAVRDEVIDLTDRRSGRPCGLGDMVEEIGEATGAGTSCGTCREHLCDLIEEHFQSRDLQVAAAS